MSIGLREKLTQTRERVSLAGILTVLAGVAAVVFTIIAVTTKSRSIPSDIALGCALAFVTGASASSGAAKKARAKRREAYERFLTSSDRLVEAHEDLRRAEPRFAAARTELDSALKKHAAIGNSANEDAAIEANKRFTLAEKALTSARTVVKNVQEEYDAAKKAAGKVARDSVRPALEQFEKCPPQNTPDRAIARSAFVRAARRDVKIRARADESAL